MAAVRASAAQRDRLPEEPRRRTRAHVGEDGAARDVLALQRAAGNGAVASLLVQRDDAGGTKRSMHLTFIVRKDGDVFTKDMKEYVQTTLRGEEFREVDNVEDICAIASDLSKQGITLSGVNIVAHGQTNVGGVGMTPKGEKKWRYVKPDEIEEFSKKADCQALQSAMAPGAEVNFWGCYIGGVPEAGMAWSNLFGTSVGSTTGQMKIERSDFQYKEGKKTKTAKSSKEVPDNAQAFFKKFLLDQYKVMSATGEAPQLKGEDKQVEYMKDLFDRGGGVIRKRAIDTGGGKMARPGDATELQLWKKAQPTR
jgi:hypothetical protein